ncbi:MAG: hypothetical protein ACT4OK_00090 [Gemmobacter sp.]
MVLGGLLAAGLVGPARADTPALRLVAAARAQVGVTTVYDPAYVTLDFPGGDIDHRRVGNLRCSAGQGPGRTAHPCRPATSSA